MITITMLGIAQTLLNPSSISCTAADASRRYLKSIWLPCITKKKSTDLAISGKMRLQCMATAAFKLVPDQTRWSTLSTNTRQNVFMCWSRRQLNTRTKQQLQRSRPMYKSIVLIRYSQCTHALSVPNQNRSICSCGNEHCYVYIAVAY